MYVFSWQKQNEFCRLRDEAFEEASPHHRRIERDFATYLNRETTSNNRWIKSFNSVVTRSYDPQVRKNIQRMIPLFTEQMQEISIKAILEEDEILIDDLRNWVVMMEDADGEAERLRCAVTHNLVHGNVITKTLYDPRSQIIRNPVIPPECFAPDPNCTQSNFSDADYVCHTTYQRRSKVMIDYPNWKPKTRRFYKNNSYDSIRIDELSVRRNRIEELDYEITGGNKDTHEIIDVILIDNEMYSITESDSFYPEFPYSFWRNFLDFGTTEKAQEFWGIGYASLMESEQRLYDELLANIILIVRNLTVGKIISEKDVLDIEQLDNYHGAITELNEDKTLEQVKEMSPADVPPFLFQILVFVRGFLQENSPAGGEIFTGQDTGDNSGRAISNRQNAAFNQFAENVRAMNEYRRHKKYVTLNFIQQYAEKPLAPHLWRGGLPMPDNFDPDSRHAKYALSFPEVSGLPFTPAGKIQFLSALQNLGIRLKAEKILDMLKLESGYGITSDDYEVVENMASQFGQSDVMPIQSNVINAVDSALPSEQHRPGA